MLASTSFHHLPLPLLLMILTPWPAHNGRGSSVGVVSAVTRAESYNLIDTLFSAYKPEVRPSTAGESTPVNVAVHLMSILSLDEKEQVMESSIILEAQWVDDYLVWEKTAHANQTRFTYRQDQIWLPDIAVENSVNSDSQFEGFDNNKVTISSSGSVTWKPAKIVRTSCDINVRYFPFDIQTCNIIISTWISTRSDVRVIPDNDFDGLALDQFRNSGQWCLEENSVSVLENENAQSRMQFTVKLRRLRTFYIINIVLPVLFLSFTASLVFYLPAKAGEKIGMGITILLAYAVYLTIVADNMPRSTLQTPILGVYIMILLAIVAFNVIATTIILHLYHKTETEPEDAVGPRTTKVIRKLRRWMWLYRKKTDVLRQTLAEKKAQNGGDGKAKSVPSKDGQRGSIVTPSDGAPPKDGQRGPVTATTEPGQPKEMISWRRSIVPADAAIVSEAFVKVWVQEKITWPKVAETIDRLMFFVVSLLILIITIIFLPVIACGDS